MKRALFTILIVGCAIAAQAGERVQVQILEKYRLREIELDANSGPWLGKNASGEAWQRQFTGETVKVRVSAGGLQVVANGETLPAENLQLRGNAEGIRVSGQGFAPRRYFGALKIGSREGKLWLRDELDLEDYVAGVLPGEISAESPIEAIKAQAVLIRSYALKHQAEADRHPGEGFDFCDLTHCQVFSGGADSKASFREAVAATRAKSCSIRVVFAETVFHSTCGGHTSANQNVFEGKAMRYLQGVDDAPYCQAAPHFSWKAAVPLEAIDRALAREPALGWVGPLADLHALSREPNGRWFSLELIGKRRIRISAEKFLSLLGREIGWNQVQSAWFEVKVQGGIAEFSGHGLGHGVGLCQEGAIGMARDGKSYREILSYYFPGTRVVRRAR